jgi:hypothetical protein
LTDEYKLLFRLPDYCNRKRKINGHDDRIIFVPNDCYQSCVGKIFFFSVNAGTTRLLDYSYDVAVAVQMFFTVYGFLNVMGITKKYYYFFCVIYMVSLVILRSPIATAKSLDFAFSKKVGDIVTTGFFGIFLHPIYVS